MLRTVTIFSGEGRQHTFSEGIAADPTTDIEVALEDVFAGVGPQAE